MGDKWYSSTIAELLGIAAVIVGIGVAARGCSGCSQLDKDPAIIRARAEAIRQGKGNILYERNILGYPAKPERFYETSAGRAYVEVDGMPIEKYLERFDENRK